MSTSASKRRRHMLAAIEDELAGRGEVLAVVSKGSHVKVYIGVRDKRTGMVGFTVGGSCPRAEMNMRRNVRAIVEGRR